MSMQVTFGLRLDERQGPSDRANFMAPFVGRQGFLGLLETYLGLAGPNTSHAERVAAYLGCLRQANDGTRFYSRSFMADDVGTAAKLLEWRDIGIWEAGRESRTMLWTSDLRRLCPPREPWPRCPRTSLST